MIKKCTKCECEKDIIDFPKDSQKKSGISPQCKQCKANYYNLKKNDDLFKKNRSERMKIYSQKPEVKERVKKYCAIYQYKPEVIERRNEISRERKKNDNEYRLKLAINKIIDKAFKRRNIPKSIPNKEILGCEYDFFLQYIESKFESYMSWGNRGLYNGQLNHGWDLDHIIPLRTAKNETDMIKINHYTNFRPLCSYVNRNIKK